MFLPLFLACYFLAKKTKTRNIILILFSLLFYAWGEPYYIFLMILMITVNYFLAIHMDKKKSKGTFIFLLIFNIFFLFSFKYLNFFIDNINGVLNLNIKNVSLRLPIGISFYTFQILSYVIDVYRGKVKVQKKFINLACYISAFPQLIAGPIVRYSDLENQIEKRTITSDKLSTGIKRFIIGLSKKVLIANNVSVICTSIISQGIKTTGFIGIVIAVIAYSAQIYFDFSGYSDMAIGLGKMCGFDYSENFNHPYIAHSITDFWRRWHISLSSFFRDYVYIPLGGNKVCKAKIIRNIVVVWCLTGLWHGDSWNFVLWGFYYAIFLIIEKFVFKDIKRGTISRIITLIIVCVGWMIFMQDNFEQLIVSFKALFFQYGFGNVSTLYYTGIFSFRYILALAVGIVFSLNKIELKDGLFRDIVLLVLLLLSIIFIVVGSYNPFIYFRF